MMNKSALLSMLLFFTTSVMLMGQPTCPAPSSNPTVTAGGLTGSNGRHSQFTISGVTSCTAAFYLFEDGHCSNQRNPNHEFQEADTYTAKYYAIDAYEDTPPMKRTATNSVTTTSTIPIGSSTANYNLGGQSVWLAKSWRAADNNKLIYIVAVKHPGGSPAQASGTITLEFDPSISYTAIHAPAGNNGAYNNWATQFLDPLQSGGHKVVWDFDQLDPGAINTRYYYAEVHIPSGVLGNFISTRVTVDYVGFGTAEKTNTSKVKKYPHDPNGIEADHSCVVGQVNDRQQLQYSVYFQNDGKNFANTVQVEVNLDGHHDLGSIDVIDSSAPITHIDIDQSGLITFTFGGIKLPGLNQIDPHTYFFDQTTGSFTFTVCSNEILPLGDQMIAEANIYFDDLQPVWAGTAISMIDDFCDYVPCDNNGQGDLRQDIPTGQAVATNHSRVVAYPNPVSDHLNIAYQVTAEQGAQVMIRLYAMSGQMQSTVLFNELRAAGKHTHDFDLSTLPAGVYLMDVINGDTRETKRLIKMK